MTRGGLFRLLVVLAAAMGAAGVALAAASAHQPDATRLASAASMLLFHASTALAAVLLVERRVIQLQLGFGAAFGLVIAAALFAGDLTLRQYAGAASDTLCALPANQIEPAPSCR